MTLAMLVIATGLQALTVWGLLSLAGVRSARGWALLAWGALALLQLGAYSRELIQADTTEGT